MGFIGKGIGAVTGSLSNGIAEGTGAINNYDPSQAQLTEGNYLGSVQSAQNGHTLDTSGADAASAQQAQLAQALQAQAQGGGPYADIAQAQLRDATARNQSLAASQVASQKGLNPALAARLAGQNQAAAQQQAANQSAMLRGQGILSSQGQLSQALQAQRQQSLAQQQNQLAQQQANTQALGTAGGLLNQQNSLRIQNLGQQQSIGAGVSAENAQTRGRVAGGLLGGAASGIASSAGGSSKGGATMAHGGMVKGYAQGGEIPQYADGSSGYVPNNQEMYDFMTNTSPNVTDSQWAAFTGANNATNTGPSSGSSGFVNALAGMGRGTSGALANVTGVKSSVPNYSGDNPWYDSQKVSEAGMKLGKAFMAHGGQAHDMRQGGHVPGHAKVSGDSLKNDTVPAMLSPGEIVIPRSIALHPDAENKAKEFVAALKGEDKVDHKANGGPVGYSKVLSKHRELEQRMAKLEKHLGKKVK